MAAKLIAAAGAVIGAVLTFEALLDAVLVPAADARAPLVGRELPQASRSYC